LGLEFVGFEPDDTAPVVLLRHKVVLESVDIRRWNDEQVPVLLEPDLCWRATDGHGFGEVLEE
jgi:hypothetical protein